MTFSGIAAVALNLYFLLTLVCIHVFSGKKYAIADDINTIGSKSFIEVSVIAWNWVSDDGSTYVYPTYLPPGKQAIAIENCMEPNLQFTSYPATIRYWFGECLVCLRFKCIIMNL